MFFRFFIIVFCLFAMACNKPEANPERLDPIYSDLEKEKKDIEGAISAEEKQLVEFKEAISAVKPQTGQIKYAQKRFYESEARLQKLRQQRTYLELHIESRLKQDRENYLKAFNKGEAWPDPKEYEIYKAQKALEAAPRTWDARGRLERSKVPNKPAAPAGH